jgi:glycosyltransferase involved in cell wall biosynthesis
VVTIHDLTYLRAPELCGPDVVGLDAHVRRALDDGAHVHAVSDFVAADVRDAYGLPADRVTRVYAGLLPSASGDGGAGRALAGSERYVLALGALDPRKNLVRLIEAFDRVAAEDPQLVLVVAGPDAAATPAVAEATGAARHRERIRRIGYVADEARRALLAGATALAYPSVTEGFGHPPLEAMQAGVPVVASSGGALPEVLGDAALLPDPIDVDAIAEALSRVTKDDDTRTALVRAGRARVSRYDWEAGASELAELYRRVTGEPPP